MASNNNRSSKSANNKSANNKTKSSTSNDMLLLLLILLICGVFVGLYYMRKRQNQREGFENDSDVDNTDNDETLSSKSKNSTKNNKAVKSSGSLEPQSGECVIALFYADWCPHCQHFKPEFKKAMSKLNGKMNNKNKTMRFEMVDCDADKNIAKKYDVSGFPTVKILNDDATTDEYSGDRTYEGLRKYLVSDD
jgi:thiol-disulfide isomerase/thioredoxin